MAIDVYHAERRGLHVIDLIFGGAKYPRQHFVDFADEPNTAALASEAPETLEEAGKTLLRVGHCE